MRSSAAVAVLLVWWSGAGLGRRWTLMDYVRQNTETTTEVTGGTTEVTGGTTEVTNGGNNATTVSEGATDAPNSNTTQATGSGGLSCKQVLQVVDGHNERRRQLLTGQVPEQPQAAQINTVVWDRELAGKAQKWAAKRELKHNPDRSVDSNRFVTGENMFLLSTSRSVFPLQRALDAWFEEHKNYQFAPLYNRHFHRPPDTQIGHYTQMVWSRSIYVGCGLAQEARAPLTDFYFVCYYGPAGNVLGQVPYETDGEYSDKLTCVGGTCDKLYGDCPKSLRYDATSTSLDEDL